MVAIYHQCRKTAYVAFACLMLSLDFDTYRCAGYSRSACITLGALVSLKKIITSGLQMILVPFLFSSTHLMAKCVTL